MALGIKKAKKPSKKKSNSTAKIWIEKALAFGLAIGSTIPPLSRFDRKSYFYPDSPRNFQITQFEKPILLGGSVTADIDGRSTTFAVNRAHLEDDAGMLKHFSDFAGIDYNRAGVPLLEIVSEPVIHSAKEASAYAMAVRSIMEYINASDCNMEEGHLRMDVNISVRPKGETGLRPKIEIKNLNSFSFAETAINLEIARQARLYTENPKAAFQSLVFPATYRFDPAKKELLLMRKKETAEDYRYFPEPDLPPIIITAEMLEKIKKTLPELPHSRFLRYTEKLGLTPYSASLLINSKPLCDYFEEALKNTPNARALCNWITVEFAGKLKETGRTLASCGIPPLHLAKLINLIESGALTGKLAKMTADEMLLHPEKDPHKILEDNPALRPISDTAELEKIIDQVLNENPQSVADFKQGTAKAFGFLMGRIMQLTKGQANPEKVSALLRQKLA
jgi:aspartyl-tRNA(Asn)/glutamyl-tRNA(Gln) amidotransferase subunit B